MSSAEKPAPRSCGSCTACCKTHSIAAILKPAQTWCVACKIGQGCSIYAERPEPCQAFRCSWLDGMGAPADRPDRLHVVVDMEESEVFGGRLIRFHELAPGAASKPKVERWQAAALEAGYAVCIMPSGGGRRLVKMPEGRDLPEGVRKVLEETGVDARQARVRIVEGRRG